MSEKTEILKLREKLVAMRDDSENWDEDQCRSFDEELLPEIEGMMDDMENGLIDKIQAKAEKKGCDSILKLSKIPK